MSKKLSGNGIWESSRMMLPEHKERINMNQREHKRKSRPIIHEDEWETILNNIGVSMYEKQEIEIQIFDSFDERTVNGVVSNIVNHLKKFKVEYDDSYEWVDFGELVSVRLK